MEITYRNDKSYSADDVRDLFLTDKANKGGAHNERYNGICQQRRI